MRGGANPKPTRGKGGSAKHIGQDNSKETGDSTGSEGDGNEPLNSRSKVLDDVTNGRLMRNDANVENGKGQPNRSKESLGDQLKVGNENGDPDMIGNPLFKFYSKGTMDKMQNTRKIESDQIMTDALNGSPLSMGKGGALKRARQDALFDNGDSIKQKDNQGGQL